MRKENATVGNGYGIHCRPSALIAQAAAEYESEITVHTANGGEADATSVLALIGLGIQYGDRVEIRAAGPDEEAALEAVAALFKRNFDFQR